VSPFVSETKRDSGMDPCPDPKRVGGWVCVQIPWGWGLGPSMVGPNVVGV